VVVVVASTIEAALPEVTWQNGALVKAVLKLIAQEVAPVNVTRPATSVEPVLRAKPAQELAVGDPRTLRVHQRGFSAPAANFREPVHGRQVAQADDFQIIVACHETPIVTATTSLRAVLGNLMSRDETIESVPHEN
jgi:hypothetical protein